VNDEYRLVPRSRKHLWTAIVLLIVALWFIWDGWFPRASVREAHPDPADHYYLFNKSVAVLLVSASLVFFYVHLVAG